MKPLQHAEISAHKHGGVWQDYIDIHEFFDQSKAHVADMRHRAMFHHSLGIYVAQQVFGLVRTNSAGRQYSVRDIGEDHVLEDLGFIPSVAQVINAINTSHLSWLGGPSRQKRMLVSKIPRSERTDRQKVEEDPSGFTQKKTMTHPGIHLANPEDASKLAPEVIGETCSKCGMEDSKHNQDCASKPEEQYPCSCPVDSTMHHPECPLNRFFEELSVVD